MFHHLVAFRFISDATSDQLSRVHEEISALPSLIPSVRQYRCGFQHSTNPLNAHYGLCATFDDEHGYLEYRDHPAHLRVVTEVVAPILDHREAVQFEGPIVGTIAR